MAWNCDVSIEEKVRQDCYNRGYEQGRKNPCEEIVRYIEELQNEVKEYKDKIEQGKMIELPCKVGDKCYYVAMYAKKKGFWGKWKKHYKVASFPFDIKVLSSFGKKWFLTREEAEKHLKELQNG